MLTENFEPGNFSFNVSPDSWLLSHWFEYCEPEHYLLKAPCSPIPTPIKLNFAYHVHSKAFRPAQIMGVNLGAFLKFSIFYPINFSF